MAVERFGMRRHLIVAGFGKLGMNFVTASRRWDMRALIVALDRDVNRAAVTQARRLSHVRFLPADIQLPGAFHHLALKRARAVVLLTDNDLLNLEVAFQLVQSHPDLRVIAHCSDLALERLLADAWDAVAQGRIHVFNSHRAAAQHLYEHHLRAHFAHTPDRDTVILAGFGRFAQTILEFLGQESQDEVERVLIAGPAASLGLRKFRSQVQPSELLDAKPFDGDLMDPEAWQAVARELGGSTVPPTVLLASDDVSVNLQSALLARRRWPDSRIFVRCQDESSFADELASAHRFTLLPVDSLLREALFLAHSSWFGEDATDSRGESLPPASRGLAHQLASSDRPS
jgi:voltage-gated potassium channel Kch